MTQYNKLNVKLFNSQLKKLKSAIKNRTEVTLNLSSNLIGNSNDETNFLHKLLLTDTQVSKIRKAFANGSSANKKFSKNQLSKIVHLGGFLYGPRNIFGSIIKKIISSPANSTKNSFVKELKNKDSKEISTNLFVDIGLNIISKELKKEFHQLQVQEQL